MRRTLFAGGVRDGTRRSRRSGIAGDAGWTRSTPYPINVGGRGGGRSRRIVRYVLRRVAVLVALLILFYATSLHGISLRTFILVGLLILSLYWLFRDAL